MCEDIRSASATPSAEERRWMAQDMLGMMVRSVALAVVAVGIGVSASMLMQPPAAPATMAGAPQAAD